MTKESLEGYGYIDEIAASCVLAMTVQLLVRNDLWIVTARLEPVLSVAEVKQSQEEN